MLPAISNASDALTSIGQAQPLASIVTDAIDGYNAGLAGELLASVSEAFDYGWAVGHEDKRAVPQPTQAPAQPSTAEADALHAAMCQAVSILNTSPLLARVEDGRKVRNILAEALVAWADAALFQQSKEQTK